MAALNWMINADADQLMCANAQLPLVRDGIPTCWSPVDYDAFLREVGNLWRNWN